MFFFIIFLPRWTSVTFTPVGFYPSEQQVSTTNRNMLVPLRSPNTIYFFFTSPTIFLCSSPHLQVVPHHLGPEILTPLSQSRWHNPNWPKQIPPPPYSTDPYHQLGFSPWKFSLNTDNLNFLNVFPFCVIFMVLFPAMGSSLAPDLTESDNAWNTTGSTLKLMTSSTSVRV